jgi:hypothetical protein
VLVLVPVPVLVLVLVLVLMLVLVLVLVLLLLLLVLVMVMVLVLVMVMVMVMMVQQQMTLNQMFDQRMSFCHRRVLSMPFGLVSIPPLPITVLSAYHGGLFIFRHCAVISHSYYGMEFQRRCLFEADEDKVAASKMHELVVNTPRRCVSYCRDDVLADERVYVEQSVVRRRFLYNVLWSDARCDLSSSDGGRRLFAGVSDEMKDALCEMLRQLEHAEIMVDESAPSDRSMDLVYFPYLRFASRDGVREGARDLHEDVDATTVGPVLRRQMRVRRCPPDVFARLIVRLCRLNRHGVASRPVIGGVSLSSTVPCMDRSAVFEYVDVFVSPLQSSDADARVDAAAATGATSEVLAQLRVSAMSGVTVTIIAWHSGAHASPEQRRRVCCGESTGDGGSVQPWSLFRRVMLQWDDVLQGVWQQLACCLLFVAFLCTPAMLL